MRRNRVERESDEKKKVVWGRCVIKERERKGKEEIDSLGENVIKGRGRI